VHFLSSGKDKSTTGESAVGCVPHTAFRVHLWREDWQRIWPGTCMFVDNFWLHAHIHFMFSQPCFWELSRLNHIPWKRTLRYSEQVFAGSVTSTVPTAFGPISKICRKPVCITVFMYLSFIITLAVSACLSLSDVYPFHLWQHVFRPSCLRADTVIFCVMLISRYQLMYCLQRLMTSFVDKLFTRKSFEASHVLADNVDNMKDKHILMPDGTRYFETAFM